MTLRRLILVLAVLAAGALAVVAGNGRPASHPVASRHAPVRGPDGPPRRIGATDPKRLLRVGLALRVREPGALRRFLRDVRTPGAADYHRYLSAAQYGARFGISDSDVRALGQRLRSRGFGVVRGYAQRTELLVTGTAGQVGRTFGVRFDDYATPRGKTFYAPRGRARVPRWLTRYVSDVGALSNRPPEPSDVPADGLKPIDIAKAYDIEPLWNQGLHGEGQTIAILSIGTFDPAEIAQFDSQVGHSSGPTIQRVAVEGGNTLDGTSEGNAGEVALDTQIVRGIAPKAQVIDYELPTDLSSVPTGFADVYNRVVQDGRASILSVSYGICEPAVSSGDATLVNNALNAAVAHGITTFFASGDSGAFDCQQQDPTIQDKAIDYPGGDPGMVVVGGTYLSVQKNGNYLNEQAWATTLTRGGTGGGVSGFNRRPSWQTGPGVDKPGLNPDGARQVPDVAGPADPASGFKICHGGSCSGGNGGTSASAPFWAASTALMQQYTEKHGGGKLGYLNPTLYQLAATKQPFPPFHDVTRGNNRAYDATPGWDYATGLGSPDVYGLAQDLNAFLKAHPGK
ncbi:MAG: hypothetical protein QOJ07_2121 [Thermoleophilaceae bacterium]|nr:hypothetical protein [Thermoleophilaceae bacterium]